MSETRKALAELCRVYNTGDQFSMQGEASDAAKSAAWAAARAALAQPEPEPTHRIKQWGHCAVCRHDRIPGEGCARSDCPDATPPQPAPQDAQPEPMATFSEPVVLPDGSAFATAAFPLPKDHWLYAPLGEWDSERDENSECPLPILTNAQRGAVTAAVRYAVRGATMCGQEADFDPDALVLNACYALCGPYNAAPPPPAPEQPECGQINSGVRCTTPRNGNERLCSDCNPRKAEQPALSDTAIYAGWRTTFSTENPFCPCDLRTFTKVARWVEHALKGTP